MPKTSLFDFDFIFNFATVYKYAKLCRYVCVYDKMTTNVI